MATLEELVEQQKSVGAELKRLITNYKKDSSSRKDLEYLQKRASILDDQWDLFEKNDHTIRTEYADQLTHPYFSKSYYETIRDGYEDTRGDIEKRMDSLRTGKGNPSGQEHEGGNSSVSGTKETSKEKYSASAHTSGVLPKRSTVESEVKIQNLIGKQDKICNILRRTMDHIQSLQHTQTQQFYQIKIATLEKYLEEAQNLHQLIWNGLNDVTTSDYDIEDFFTLEEAAQNKLIELHEACSRDNQGRQGVTQATLNTSSSEGNTVSGMKLPKIVIPKFDGDYLKWRQFCDLFTELVHNQHVADCQKMWYLKTSLSGEAEKLIRHLTISDANYATAWQLIKERYENPRLLSTALLNKLLSQPSANTESSSLIKNLHDTTQECLFGLQNLGIDITNWGPIISHILLKKLDKQTFTLYEQSLEHPRQLQPLKNLMSFLEVRFQSLEACGNKAPSFDEGRRYTKSATSMLATGPSCNLCKGVHQLFACPRFLQWTPGKRYEHVKKLNLCINCLANGHSVIKCSSRACRKCFKKHNTLLHRDYTPSKNTSEPSEQQAGTKQTSSNSPTLNQGSAISLAAKGLQQRKRYILLGTALVKLIGRDGRSVDCRAILDSGSQLNLISKKLAKDLGLQERSEDISIEGIGDQRQSVKRRVNVLLKSHTSNFNVHLEAHVLPKIVSQQPACYLNTETWPLPKNVRLADPKFNEPNEVDLLIGAENYFSLLSVGQIQLGDNYPLLQNTVLGWIVAGKVENQLAEANVCGILSDNEDLNKTMERFWQLEEKEDSTNTHTAEEQRCESFFNQTTRRHTDGRFIVRLPFKDTQTSLGDSSGLAYQRLLSLERKLEKNDELRALYTDFMNEYIRLGHMEEIEFNKAEKPYYFLPHHCVIKPDSTSTKLRVVFDGSATTTSNKSLNDIISKGPTIQDDVFSVLLRFRMPRYVFTADIEKMYRQIWIHEDDKRFQLIWWREQPTSRVRCFQLNTVTYGTTSAPYLAIRCLQKVAEDGKDRYPLGSHAIKQGFYVDDVLTGADSLRDAIDLQEQLRSLLNTAGFKLRKWSSNHPRLLKNISSEDKEVELEFDKNPDGQIKTIGMAWLPVSDEFRVRAIRKDNSKVTKRIALSEIAQLFDPLGIVGPVVVTAKIFLQKLWTLKLDWDAALPQDLHTFWEEFRRSLSVLNNIKFPRHVLNHNIPKMIQIHIFADASEKAYGAVAYVRAINKDATITVRLLCAKSKVAPIKKTTLPRLELCAAKVAAELSHRIKKDLNLQGEQLYLWSDSQIVLAWINSSTSTFHTFVANRVATIQELTIPSQWRHIGSEHNPADLISRGTTPEKLSQSLLWFYGPVLLHKNESLWPSPVSSSETDYAEERRKKATVARFTISGSLLETINHHNSFKKLQRIIAYVLRFTSRGSTQRQSSTVISADELYTAKNIIVKQMQQDKLRDDINHIRRYGEVNKSSNLSSLTPFLDDQGLLRVGGRLQASNLVNDAKHQLLLPYEHPITKLIMSDLHKSNHHIGPQALLAITRQQFWPIKGKTLARSIVDHCVQCARAKPKLLNQLMGNLPAQRVQPARPFVNSGVDFCGPVRTHYKLRGKRPQKSYIAVFCCFATKAVHLELVTDLTTQGFIAALRRFMARRGHCRNIFCDNATNFVGAKAQLEELRKMVEDEEARTHITSTCSSKGIDFRFIPPRSPHFGGLWEAAVKSAKSLLQHTLASAELTYEELETVVVEIEAILNSRPITPMSSNPNDLTALTPAHFLIGEELTNPIDATATTEKLTLSKRWTMITRLKNEFWRRWTTEYLNQLQCRYKWKQKGPKVKIGMLVIIKDDNLPPLRWPLGRIVEVFKGKDGLIRAVDVRTSRGIFRRSIHGLAPLPIEEESTEDNLPSSNQIDQKIGSSTHKQYDDSNELGNPGPSTYNQGDVSSNQRPEVKHSKKKQRLSLGTAITTLLLTCTILPFGSSNANPITVKPFESQPGLYFENLGIANIVTNEWHIIAFYNMTPFWTEFRAVTTCINTLKAICRQLKDQNSCNGVIMDFQHIIEEISQSNELLLPPESHTRVKRAPLGIVGSLMKSLFGVLDEEYATKMAETIEAVKNNDRRHAQLLANQTSVIDATINIIRRDQERVTNQIKEWNQHINKLTTEINKLRQELQDDHYSNVFTTTAMQGFIVMTNFQRIQSSIIDVLVDTHHGKFNPQLITPDQLRRELHRIKNNLPSQLRLPAPQEDIRNYYSLITIEGRPTQGHIIFKLSLPLIAIDDFELLKPIPVPIPYNNTFIMVQPSSPFLLVNLHRDQYSAFQHLQSCVITIGGNYLCKPSHPLYNKKSNISSCEIELLNHQPHPPSCKIVNAGKGLHWIPLHNPNRWIYATENKTIINIVCDNKIEHLTLKGSGLLELEGDCTIKQSFLTIRSNSILQGSSSLSYLPSYNLTDGNDKQAIPLSVQSYHSQTSELDALKAQLQQWKIEEMIVNQQQEVHQFTIGYISLLLGFIIMGWILYRYWYKCHNTHRTHQVAAKPIPAPREIFKKEILNQDNDSDFEIDFNV